MKLVSYLESTYLKTPDEASLSNKETIGIITKLVNQAIEYDFKLVMIRANHIKLAQQIISQKKSHLLIGTVVDFPFGSSSTLNKVNEAKIALELGADEIDYVADYNGFKQGLFEKFDDDIRSGTMLGFNNNKIVKWIIETGALSKEEIRNITIRISKIVRNSFPNFYENVYIKTSTGYYGGYGAEVKDVKLIVSVSSGLPVKASGGISNFSFCKELINAGASRIGTSKALDILMEK